MNRQTKQNVCNIIAGIAIIPALILLANLTVFAFTGSGFLPEASEQMHTARVVITAIVVALAPLISALGEVV